MIFNLYERVAVKIGDERHVFDRKRLMFTEVAEIEKVTGLSYAEWERQMGRFSITAVAALVHVLRKREGKPSDFGSMQFNATDLAVVPLHDDGSEFTVDEVAADLAKRMAKAADEPDPTIAAAVAAVAAEQAAASQPDTATSSPSSPSSTRSGRGSGTASSGATSSSSKRALTPG